MAKSEKVGIYTRLSEEDRNKQQKTDDSNSIQNQKLMLEQYAVEQGWEIYGFYNDDDYAGADRKRPAFNRLLKDAEQHKFDIVLCKTQSRFTRELELVEKYIHGLFPLWGIRFVSIVDNADTSEKGNKKSRQINGLVNEWYLEDMSENIRSVLKNRRKNGFHIGAFALYGYQKDPCQKGHLIIDGEAAAVVREVFALFSQGYGKTAIARKLNERGIPNPTEYKRLHGLRYQQPKRKNSTLWGYSAISSMLSNEIYAGNMVQGKYGSISYKTKQNKPRPKSEWYVVEGTHEPIIDRELWDRVQALLAERAKPFSGGTEGLFSRKARCAGCGYVLRSAKSHGRHYLQCPCRRLAKDACAGAFISADSLEQAVIAELKGLSAHYLDINEIGRKAKPCGGLQEQKERILSEIAGCEKRAAEYAKGLGGLYMDKVRGAITEDDYKSLAKELSAEKKRLERAVSDAKSRLAWIDREMESAESGEPLAEKYTRLDRLNREVVSAMIDYILVGRRTPGTRIVPVEIHWNF